MSFQVPTTPITASQLDKARMEILGCKALDPYYRNERHLLKQRLTAEWLDALVPYPTFTFIPFNLSK